MSAVDCLVRPRDLPEERQRATAESFALVARPEDALYEGPWHEVLGQGRADYVLLLSAGDRLECGGLEALTSLARASRADVVLMDRATDAGRTPTSRWLPLLAEQLSWWGTPALVRRDLAEQVLIAEVDTLEGAELLSHLTGRAQRVRVCPVAAVIEGPPAETSTDQRLQAARRALADTGRAELEVTASPAGFPLVRGPVRSDQKVSIIVPTAFVSRAVGDGSPEVLLERLLRALEAVETGHDLWELVLVVDEAAPTERLEAARQAVGERLTVVRTHGAFSFAGAINAAALAARGEVLLLLNDDVEPVTESWMAQMLGVLAREEVVAVGSRLLFDDGTIQHLGIVWPPQELPTHPRIFEQDDPTHPLAQADVPYLAVTGACLMCSRADLLAVGGMDEELPLNFNDVDLCLKLGSGGRQVVCANSVRMIHRESSTREPQITEQETAALTRWEGLAWCDPHVEYWG